MSEVRAFAFRERASQAHQKAMRAGIPEATRRAWLIVKRDWTRMAEQEELKDAMSWLDSAAASRREREVIDAGFRKSPLSLIFLLTGHDDFQRTIW